MTLTDDEKRAGTELLAKFMGWKYYSEAQYGFEGFIDPQQPDNLIQRNNFSPHSDLNHIALVEDRIGEKGEEWQRMYGRKLGDMLFNNTKGKVVQPTHFTVATAPPEVRFKATIATVKEMEV